MAQERSLSGPVSAIVPVSISGDWMPKNKVQDLFDKLEAEVAPNAAKAKAVKAKGGEESYTAADIEVLEGLEPVRRRPGMYIGGTDEKALHHLFAEVIDNSMDEAVAGHASFIEVEYEKDGCLTVTDNGRGIPVDPHPKFKDKSALEVIMTTLHAGGKFDSKVYETSGGLHGVGVSVVNALSEPVDSGGGARPAALPADLQARPSRRAKSRSSARSTTAAAPRCASSPIRRFSARTRASSPSRLFRMARSKAYLFGGVEIRWKTDPLEPQGQGHAGKGDAAFPRRPQGLPRRAPRRHTRASPTRPSRAKSPSPAAMARWNGRSPGSAARTASRPPTATPSRPMTAAPTNWACARALTALAQELRRAYRQQARRRDHRRRRDGFHGRAALGLHPRAGVPGPDQGQARHARSRSASSRRRSATISTIG